MGYQRQGWVYLLPLLPADHPVHPAHLAQSRNYQPLRWWIFSGLGRVNRVGRVIRDV